MCCLRVWSTVCCEYVCRVAVGMCAYLVYVHVESVPVGAVTACDVNCVCVYRVYSRP